MKDNKNKLVVILVCIALFLVGFMGGQLISICIENSISIENNVNIENNISIENNINIEHDSDNEDDDFSEKDSASTDDEQKDSFLGIFENLFYSISDNGFFVCLLVIFLISLSYSLCIRVGRFFTS